jgi:hypothetical protein
MDSYWLLPPGILHDSFHLRHRISQPAEQGAGNDGMPDIQFADLRYGGDGVDIVVMQAMAGMHPQACIRGHID